MSNWSYSNNPENSELDAVRFLIGDTDASDPQLNNNEIEYTLSTEGSVTKAAVSCCEALYAKYSRLVDETVGSVSFRLSTRAKQYMDLSKTLRRKNDIRSAKVYAGGISKTDKSVEETNTDRVDPEFTRDLHDNNCSSTDDNEC